MKKLIVLVLAWACVLGLAGCGYNPKKPVAGHIDQNVTKIDITHRVGVEITEWSVEGKEIEALREWSDKLAYTLVEVEEGKTPGDNNGGEVYNFAFTGGVWPNFSYVINGKDDCYILFEGNWFVVTNPSNPPVVEPTVSEISESSATEMQESQQTTAAKMQEKESAVITPLPVTIDITKLEDCMVAISLEKGDFYRDKTGAVMMDVTVFVYDLYDMVDISLMKEGDIILRGQDEIKISSIERKENGLVLINGGLDKGGFELFTEENTVYYEKGYSDVKSYYELGKVTLPVSPDFIYNDASDLDKDAVIWGAEDFLKDAAGIDYHFNANNTTIQIEKGYVTAMTRVYAP